MSGVGKPLNAFLSSPLQPVPTFPLFSKRVLTYSLTLVFSFAAVHVNVISVSIINVINCWIVFLNSGEAP